MRAAQRGGGPPPPVLVRQACASPTRVRSCGWDASFSATLADAPQRSPGDREEVATQSHLCASRSTRALLDSGPCRVLSLNPSPPPPAHAATAVFPKQSEKGGGRVGPGLSLSPAKPRVRLALGGPKAVPRAQTQGTSPGAGPARPCAGGLEASVGGTQPGWGSARPRRHGASGRFPACGGGPTLHSAELAAVIPISLFPWPFVSYTVV